TRGPISAWAQPTAWTRCTWSGRTVPRRRFRADRPTAWWCFGKGRGNVSANDATVATAGPQRPPRPRYRTSWFYAVAAAGCLLVGGGLYLGLARRAPEPPTIDPTRIDPLIVAAVEKGRAAVRESPDSAAAWGRLGMILQVHDFRTQADFCLDQAE